MVSVMPKDDYRKRFERLKQVQRDQLKKDTILPDTVDEVITLLDELYPERSPSVEENNNRLMFRGGQRSVVNFLLELKHRSEM